MDITAAVLEESGRPRPFAASRPLTIGTLQLDPPGPTELLVRIEAAGVCHSDLSVVDGNRPRPTPMALGHEAAGIVEQAGDEVRDITVGQRVVMTFLPRCGECAACATDGQLPCERGTASNTAGTLLHGGERLTRDGERIRHHLGVSAFASHAVVERASVVPVPDDVPADIAAVLGCAVLTGGGAVRNVVKPRPDDSLAIVGLGGVGMAALLTAASLGVRRLVAVDSAPAKLEQALALGAHDALTPDQATERKVRTTHALECAGNAKAFELAFAMTAPGGRTVTVGLPAPSATATIAPVTITAEARSIIGSYLGSAVPSRDIPAYVELWRDGRLPLEKLISDRIRLQDVNAAMDALADATALRQVIVFD